MKRKRGNKKGKAKGKTALSVNETSITEVSHEINQEGNSGEGESAKHGFGMEVDNTTSSGTDQPHNVANINPDGSIDKLSGKSVGRVKVKLKTSKKLESQPTSSDALSHSDNTDRSSQQKQGFQKHGLGVVNEKMEDSANSLPDRKVNLTPKKTGTGGIKIKSSNVLGSSNSQTGNNGLVYAQITYQKQPKAPKRDSGYNKQELDAALMVIKKVMKMDAAEPFNVPVNPEALGIPDYFDIINTPMDFGTICNNLERYNKYRNSEDVFKDVQYIWDNCYKYNNKGDYILDLMRRVKKNFMKYWTGAGLFTEKSRGSRGTEATLSEELGLPDQVTLAIGTQGKQKTGKRHGRHKPDCLCAICVLKRRRKEREQQARMAKGSAGGEKVATEFNQEEPLLVESPGGEDSSSVMEYSAGPEADAEGEEKVEDVEQEASEKRSSSSEERQDNGGDDDDDEEEDEEEEEEDQKEDANEENETDIQKTEIEIVDHKQLSDGLEAQDKLRQPRPRQIFRSREETVSQDEAIAVQDEQQTAAIQRQKLKDTLQKDYRAKILENLVPENPVLLEMCGILFPQDMKSVWNGPHSLNGNQKKANSGSLSAAMEIFMT